MTYFYLISSRTVIEAFESRSSDKLKLDNVEDAPDGDGLFFDLDSIRSILVWLKENKDAIIVSANLLKAALDYLNSGKSQGQPVTIVVRLPDNTEEKIEITASTTEDEVRQKIQKLTSAGRDA